MSFRASTADVPASDDWKTRPSVTAPQTDAPGADANIAELVATLRSNAILIAVVVAVFLAAAFAYIVLTPTTYKATTSLVVDTRGRAAPTDVDTAQSGGIQDPAAAETQMRVFTSASVLGRVVDAEDLGNDPEFATPRSGLLGSLFGSAAAPVESLADRKLIAMDALSNAIVARRSERSYVVDIDVSTRTPKKSKRLADAVGQAYLDDLQAERQKLVGRDMDVVAQRLADLRGRVDDATRKASDFKLQNGIADANGRNLLEQQLSNATDDLTRAHDRAVDAKSRYEQVLRLQRAGRPTDAVGDALKSPSLERLRGQLAELTRQRANLGTTLGARHPAMAEIESQLRDIRTLITQEVARIGVGTANEYQVARDSEAESQRRVDELRKLVEQRTDVMAQLKILERDADTTRTAYERYLRVREANSEGPAPVIARIIAPAAVPTFASSPRRLPALLIALFGGLFTGATLAFIKDLVAPSRRQIVAAPAEPEPLPAPVGGAVPVAAETPVPNPTLDPAPVDPAPSPAGVAEPGPLVAPTRTAPAGRRPPAILTELPLVAAQTASGDGEPAIYRTSAPYRAAIADLFDLLCPGGAPATGAVRILVTSFLPGSGKTMLALALARFAAEQGASTLLVDGNPASPMSLDIIPPNARRGVIELEQDARVGYVVRESAKADLCIVPILDDDAEVIEHLRGRSTTSRDAMPATAHVMIFDAGTIDDEDTIDLAAAADHIVVLAGPADGRRLRGADPAALLEVPRASIAGYVLSPVDGTARTRVAAQARA